MDENLQGILLLVLSLSGNFFGQLLGCNTQKLLKNIMIFKHIFQVISIYISMDLYSSVTLNPLLKLRNTIGFYLLFIIVNKMNQFFTRLVFLLILLMFIINNYIDYYNSIKKDSEYLTQINTFLTRVCFVTIFVGFIIYYFDKKSEYSTNWDNYKFLFGVTKCKGIKN